MLYYLLQVLVLQFIFLLFYRWFLRRETFFSWNRLYLLGTALLSFFLPLLRFGWLEKNSEWHETLAPVIIGSSRIEQNLHQQVEVSYQSQLLLLYIAGVVLFGTLFALKLFQIFSLPKKYPVIRENAYKIVLLPGPAEVFSFMNYIFIDEKLYRQKDWAILAHEEVHLKEKHWLDLLFFELLKILLWFSPFIRVYQKEIRLLHEYIADNQSLKQNSIAEYFDKILQETFQVRKVSFVNQFYQPKLLKKRIKMLNRKKSTRLSLLKYVAFIGIVVGLSLLVDACKQENYSEDNQENVITKEELNKMNSDDIGKIIVTKHPDKVRIILKNGEEFVYYPEDKTEMIHSLNKQIVSEKTDADSEDVEVAFQFLKTPPVIKGCEGLEGDEAKDCFSKKIREFVTKNFNTELADSLDLKGEKVKILTMFTFDKQGKVTNIRARSKYPELADEAKRVITMLPQVEPGKQNGKPVKVTYTMPIIFNVE